MNAGSFLILRNSKLQKYIHIYIYIYIYIKLQTEPFRPTGPHQCNADEQDGEAYII